MTKAGIDYVRGIYQTAIDKKEKAKSISSTYSRGYLSGYHSSTIDLCESLAQFENFDLIEKDIAPGRDVTYGNPFKKRFEV